jgi:hypothetical protein
MRLDDSLEIVVHTRSTALHNTHIDPCRSYIALGIYHDVWKEDVLEYFKTDDPSTLPQRIPHIIPLKDSSHGCPVFMAADGERPWSVSAFRHQYSKAAQSNGFSRVSPYTLRTSSATNLNNAGVGKPTLQYFYGHKGSSDLVYTAYQSQFHEVDMVAHLLDGEKHKNDVVGMRGSVSWETYVSGKLTDADKQRILLAIAYVAPQALKIAIMTREAKEEMTSKLGLDAVVNHPDHSLVNDYLDFTFAAQAVFDEAIRLFCDGGPRQSSLSPTHQSLIIDTFATPYQALRDALLYSDEHQASDTISAACSSALDHIFLAVARKNTAKPSFAILERMLALMAADDVEDAGDCKYCLIRGVITTQSQKNNISAHMLKCEALLHVGEERCNICLLFIPILPKTPALPTNDVATSIERYHEHHQACHDNLVNGTVVEEEEGEPQQGLLRYSLTSVATGVRRRNPLRRIFCPICLFDCTLAWDKRHQ